MPSYLFQLTGFVLMGVALLIWRHKYYQAMRTISWLSFHAQNWQSDLKFASRFIEDPEARNRKASKNIVDDVTTRIRTAFEGK